MYKLADVREIHLELTSRCQASCPMCPRNFRGGITNPWLVETEISIEQFKQWFPETFIKQLDRLFMCGNLGDAIVAKDTIEVFQYLRDTNPNMFLGLHTNGSARPAKWWERLAELNVVVTFALDGLEDTNHLYRIGTDFNKIIENAKTFINAGGRARWHMLVFDHNKHQIEAAKKMSQDLGFFEFTQKNSSRFNGPYTQVLTKDGKTSHNIYPSDRSLEISQKIIEHKVKMMLKPEEELATEIHCKSQQGKSMYVGANGAVTPCCWLEFTGYEPFNKSVVDYNDKGFITPNLYNNTLEEIFASDYFTRIEETWTCGPLRQCSKQCGKVDKLNEQFK